MDYAHFKFGCSETSNCRGAKNDTRGIGACYRHIFFGQTFRRAARCYKNIGYVEDTLRQFGCTYTTGNPKNIEKALDILKKANLRGNKEDKDALTDYYGAIYLKEDNGSVEKIIFGHYLYTFPTISIMLNEQPAKANSTLVKELLEWAVRLSRTNKCSSESGGSFSLGLKY